MLHSKSFSGYVCRRDKEVDTLPCIIHYDELMGVNFTAASGRLYLRPGVDLRVAHESCVEGESAAHCATPSLAAEVW